MSAPIASPPTAPPGDRDPVAGPSHRPTRSSAAGAGALLTGTGLLMLGVGLQASLLGVRATGLGFATTTTGLVLTTYYVGFLAGSLAVVRLVRNVGHIRTFTALTALASAAVLLHVVFEHPAAWAAIRLVSGACTAGIFVVAESWLHGTTDNAGRGRLLGVYMVVVLGAMGLGQLLLNAAPVDGPELFILVSVLVSGAAVPVALGRQQTPPTLEIDAVSTRTLWHLAPLGVVGSFAAGLLVSALLGFGAAWAGTVGLSVGETSALVGSAVLAGALVQWPMGRLSDRVDRRLVVAASGLAAAALAAIVALDTSIATPTLVVLVGVLGGAVFPLYSLCAAHVNDYLEGPQLVGASGRLVLLNGLGATFGPLTAGIATALVGPAGFFWLVASVSAAVGTYAGFRITRRRRAPEPAPYAPVPPLPTPATSGLNPVVHDPGPPASGRIAVDDAQLTYDAQGRGSPVVVIHGTGQDRSVWHALRTELALRDRRSVVFDRRGHGESTPGASYDRARHARDLATLLDHLGADRVDLVGIDDGAAIAIAIAHDRPDQVASVTLVDDLRGIDPRVETGRGRGARFAQRIGYSVLRRRAMARVRAAHDHDPRTSPDHFDALYHAGQVADPTAVLESEAALAEPRPIPPVPVRVVAGERAPRPVGDAAMSVARAAGTPVAWIPGAGRHAALDHPGLVADAVVRTGVGPADGRGT